MGFFGELSPFEIIVSVIAIFTGVYTFFWPFIEKPKLKIFTGDRMNLVISNSSKTLTENIFAITKFHIGCNLVNPTNKVAVLHHLEAEVVNNQGVSFVYTWNIFFQYFTENGTYQKANDVHPISVNPHSNTMVFIEFKAIYPENSFQSWSERYAIQLKGWVNLENRKEKPNLISPVFHIDLASQNTNNWQLGKPGTPNVYPVKVEEWTSY